MACVGLLERRGGIGILEREVGHQFVRFDELRIELERFFVPLDGRIVESVRADEREAQIGLRVFGIALQGFLEEDFRVGIVEALVQQPAPADASRARCRRIARRPGEIDRWRRDTFRGPSILRRGGRDRAAAKASRSRRAPRPPGRACAAWRSRLASRPRPGRRAAPR